MDYTEYSPEIGQAFLESEARLREWNPKALSFKATVIRRLDEYINGRNYTFARLRIFTNAPNVLRVNWRLFYRLSVMKATKRLPYANTAHSL